MGTLGNDRVVDRIAHRTHLRIVYCGDGLRIEHQMTRHDRNALQFTRFL